MKLEGKCALVTGAGIGIGREVALEYARQGADVVLSYHTSSDGALSAVDEIRGMGRHALARRADLTKVQACTALVEGAIDFLGRLDILVNNAGVTAAKSFLEVTPEEFDDLYHLNIRGQYFCAQRAARAMREQGKGIIINTLSIHAFAGYPGLSVYAGTKGAILATTRELAVELAPYHIRVVGVAPGAIDVPRFYRQIKDYSPEAMGQIIPWGRVGRPRDIAKVCAFLASDDADFLVGSIITVDGGTMAKMALDMEIL